MSDVVTKEKNRFSITVDIHAPAERIWAIMSDVERWHEWTPSVVSIKKMNGEGPLRVGSRMVVQQPKLPKGVWTIERLEEGHGFISMTGSSMARVTAHHWIRPDEKGTKVTLAVEFSGLFGSVLALITGKLNIRYLEWEASGLKKRCENQ